MQAASHAPQPQQQPQPVAPPAAPKVLPAQFEPIARILKSYSAQLATQMPKRKHDDLERRLQQLSEKLTACQLSDATCHRLLNLCGALQRQDLRAAAEIQTEMTTKDWDENGFWLVGIKWMIDGK
jgi:protein transport protein SEC31